MFFMKLNPDYGFMVMMIYASIIKVKEFALFFFLWILFFAIQYKVLNVHFDGCDYNFSDFMNNLITVLRISTGDI